MARSPSTPALTRADLRARWLLAEALGPPRARTPHPLAWSSPARSEKAAPPPAAADALPPGSEATSSAEPATAQSERSERSDG
jgi:hypothetical protein